MLGNLLYPDLDLLYLSILCISLEKPCNTKNNINLSITFIYCSLHNSIKIHITVNYEQL